MTGSWKDLYIVSCTQLPLFLCSLSAWNPVCPESRGATRSPIGTQKYRFFLGWIPLGINGSFVSTAALGKADQDVYILSKPILQPPPNPCRYVAVAWSTTRTRDTRLHISQPPPHPSHEAPQCSWQVTTLLPIS